MLNSFSQRCIPSELDGAHLLVGYHPLEAVPDPPKHYQKILVNAEIVVIHVYLFEDFDYGLRAHSRSLEEYPVKRNSHENNDLNLSFMGA